MLVHVTIYKALSIAQITIRLNITYLHTFHLVDINLCDKRMGTYLRTEHLFKGDAFGNLTSKAYSRGRLFGDPLSRY